jgi:hypothetical protein
LYAITTCNVYIVGKLVSATASFSN